MRFVQEDQQGHQQRGHKKSLIYIINNVTADIFTITLSAEVYARLSEDTEVLEALANHPNISLASA